MAFLFVVDLFNCSDKCIFSTALGNLCIRYLSCSQTTTYTTYSLPINHADPNCSRIFMVQKEIIKCYIYVVACRRAMSNIKFNDTGI